MFERCERLVSFAAYYVLATRLSTAYVMLSAQLLLTDLILLMVYLLSTRSYRVPNRCTIINSTLTVLPDSQIRQNSVLQLRCKNKYFYRYSKPKCRSNRYYKF